MWRRLRVAFMAAVLFTLGGGVWGGTVAQADAGAGNSAAAHLCQKGGYQTLQTDTGGSFASQDACVSYGATDGTLFHPVITQTTGITGVTQNAPFCLLFGHVGTGWCVDILGSGFHPNIPLTVTESVNGGPLFAWLPGAHTEPSGTFEFAILNACGRGNLGTVFTLNVTDAQGVHATVTSDAVPC